MCRKILLLLLILNFYGYAAWQSAFAAETNVKISSSSLSSGLVSKGSFIWGINGHPLGGAGVYTEDRGVSLAQQFGLVKELGFTWYRFDVFAVEPNDELDTIVPPAEKAGIKLYPTLHPPIELRPYTTLPSRFDNNDVYKKCFEHARSVAGKWRGRIKVWDLSNEPDGWVIKDERHGNKREDYEPNLVAVAAAILKGQSDGIKAGDPDAKVSLNTGGWLHYGFVDLMIENGINFDILSWHWYNEMGDIDCIKKMENFNLLKELKKYDKPIWLGEYNYRPKKDKKAGYDPVDNAWLLETIQRLYSYRNNGVEAVFIYELLDFPSDDIGSGYYGLVGVDRKPGMDGKEIFVITERKPIYYEIQSWLTSLKVFQIHQKN
ncbi:MAG: hypothetical protein A2017_05685 [Lentisphaerae bacterium GWF2_44_16]|nr:MAG: hypothetical protein A2017_05685 [Lentisphaerae bacterium GWF2_44_16]